MVKVDGHTLYDLFAVSIIVKDSITIGHLPQDDICMCTFLS